MREMRSARPFAWTTVPVAVAAYIGGAWLGFARGSARVAGTTPQTWLDVVTPLPFVAFPVVGAVIITKQPRNAIDWLLSLVGATATIGTAQARDGWRRAD
jgi:hypothetical protein